MTQKEKYFSDLKSLLQKEMEHEKREIADQIQHLSLKERAKKGISWKNCFVKEHGFTVGQYPYVVVQTDAIDEHQFSSGASVEVFCGDEEPSVKGGVQWIHKNKMQILLFTDDVPHFLKGHHFHVDLDFNQKQYDKALNAMDFALKAKNCFQETITDVLLGLNPSENKGVEIFLQDASSLNEIQQKAAENILNSNDVAIVHGPPGTGKTTVLIHAIDEVLQQDPNASVLYVTPGNSAANFVTLELQKRNTPVLRIGNPTKFDETLYALTPESKLEKSADYSQVKSLRRQAEEYFNLAGKYKRQFGKAEREQRKELRKEARDILKDARKHERYLLDKVMNAHNVFTCTPIGSRADLLSSQSFDYVFIDEAAQGIEPFLWVPIIKGRRIIMAGDPFQLPPTVKSNPNSKGGLSVTLMEKCLQNHNASQIMLEVQYRMHEQIMSFPSQYFYNSQLRADPSVKDTTFEFPIGKNNALVFYDTAGCGMDEKEEGSTSSKLNEGEAELVQKLATQLSPQHSLAIITPYKGQVRLLEEVLEDGFKGVVNTVDAFQGQERDVIIISLVRSNTNGEIGFLKDYRRMNVAMTRARQKLILIGDSSTFGNDPFYSEMLDYIENIERWGSAWELM